MKNLLTLIAGIAITSAASAQVTCAIPAGCEGEIVTRTYDSHIRRRITQTGTQIFDRNSGEFIETITHCVPPGSSSMSCSGTPLVPFAPFEGLPDLMIPPEPAPAPAPVAPTVSEESRREALLQQRRDFRKRFGLAPLREPSRSTPSGTSRTIVRGSSSTPGGVRSTVTNRATLIVRD